MESTRHFDMASLPVTPVFKSGFGPSRPHVHWQEWLGCAVLWSTRKLLAQPLRLSRDPRYGYRDCRQISAGYRGWW